MTKYRSIVVVKYTRHGMMKAIDHKITEMLDKGYEFVQMSGNPIESIILLFKIDGDEKRPPTRKELRQIKKDEKARLKYLKKHPEEANRPVAVVHPPVQEAKVEEVSPVEVVKEPVKTVEPAPAVEPAKVVEEPTPATPSPEVVPTEEDTPTPKAKPKKTSSNLFKKKTPPTTPPTT